MDKKQSQLSVLMGYASGRGVLTYISLVLSGLSALMALVPFIYIWAMVRDVMEVAPRYEQAHSIGRYGWMAVLFALGGIVVYVLALLCSHMAAFRVASNMRKRLMEHIFTLPIGFMSGLGSGKVRKWVNESTASTETFLAHQLPDRAFMLATMLGLVVLMLLFDWRMGLLCIAAAIVSVVLLFVFMSGRTQRGLMAEYNQALDDMSNEAVEYVRGVPVVKTFGQSVFSFKRFKGAIDRYQREVIGYTLSFRAPMVAYAAMANGVFALLIAFTLLVVRDGPPSSGYVLNLIYYIIISPVVTISLSRMMFASKEKLIVAEALSRIDHLRSIDPLHDPAIPQMPADNDLVLKQVVFRYPGAQRNAIDGISLSAPAGSRIALVGSSGGGKTTLAQLMARFFDAQDGEITLGGVDVKRIAKDELMARIAFVFQDSRLLKTSIMENVRLGRPSASRHEVLQALHRAQCDDIVAKLPQGIDTPIGPQGVYLSGGEQQRIAIARAMLKDAPIVILDEATAFADPDNEVRVQRAFSALAEDRTLIMIAHRLSSVVGADRIYVLNDGRVVEEGAHAELLERNGRYAAMWNQYVKSVKWNIK
ncbi:MAG: ABC transporter ATP-binding protein [Bacteroidales bacterium]|nr:ABC transporter ATP-binding protein [Bacteroidales bacterium]